MRSMAELFALVSPPPGITKRSRSNPGLNGMAELFALVSPQTRDRANGESK